LIGTGTHQTANEIVMMEGSESVKSNTPLTTPTSEADNACVVNYTARALCAHEPQRVLHTKDHASQEQLHVVDERVLGYVLNTKTRHGCTRTVKTSTLS
jgi:hypothetical protein